MDMEKDAKRMQALDEGSDALSQQMRKLRQKADDFVGLRTYQATMRNTLIAQIRC